MSNLSRNTVSPYEFYARPLKIAKLKEAYQGDTGADGFNSAADEEENAMISANDELANFAEELNSFYGHPKNRKLINSSQVFVYSLQQLSRFIYLLIF